MIRPRALTNQLIEDARVRVTRFDFEPGAETGWHTHTFDYLITAITDCNMLVEHPDGTCTSFYVPAGTAYRREEGVQHNVINDGTAQMSFIEVELK
jgi:mannose-6-phosphate isomerase-like protein (cupin superfamily)